MQIVSKPRNRKSTQRVEALSVLPVFFSLDGKRVIVAGGTDAAAWKAELLAASGALVDVCALALDVSEEMAELLANGVAAGALRHVDADWRDVDFGGAALAIGDIEEEDAAAFVAKARGAAVPVNVVDKPAFCDFQFGSIVNRSPVVVGISTDGAAPILGQAVRRRIEMLLPSSLGEWGRLAREVRGKVMNTLAAGAQRRAFWERFVDRAFSGRPAEALDIAGTVVANDLDAVGKVTLVGAGPGDAELLTVKAVRALQAADVILFDDLVSGDVLELARREAKRMLVGKRGGRESCKQDDINNLMLKFAQQGKHVVRLKSGDPMIFGRAGEEISMLEQHGVAVSIVPGISAANALASTLNISLTHRDFAQSVRFVTGHSRKGKLPENLNWSELADPAVTSVFYMCRGTMGAIAGTLNQHGMTQQTPIVIAANVGRNTQKLWRGKLADWQAGQAILTDEDVVLMGVGNAFAARGEQLGALPQPEMAAAAYAV